MGSVAGGIALTDHSDTGQSAFSKVARTTGCPGAVDARCVSPDLILQAQLPSGPTEMRTSPGRSSGSVTVIAIKQWSVTRTPAMPSPTVEQTNRTIAPHAATSRARLHDHEGQHSVSTTI